MARRYAIDRASDNLGRAPRARVGPRARSPHPSGSCEWTIRAFSAIVCERGWAQSLRVVRASRRGAGDGCTPFSPAANGVSSTHGVGEAPHASRRRRGAGLGSRSPLGLFGGGRPRDCADGRLRRRRRRRAARRPVGLDRARREREPRSVRLLLERVRHLHGAGQLRAGRLDPCRQRQVGARRPRRQCLGVDARRVQDSLRRDAMHGLRLRRRGDFTGLARGRLRLLGGVPHRVVPWQQLGHEPQRRQWGAVRARSVMPGATEAHEREQTSR